MRRIRRLIVIFLVLSPFVAHAQSSSVSIQVAGDTRASMQTVASILERRFDSIRPGFFTSVSTQVNGSRITIQFSRWAPSNAQTNYLLQTTGRLNISIQGERDNPLVLESDIADSRPVAERDKSELAIRLTETASSKVEARTRSMTGKIVDVEWEGRVVARLRIAGPLSRNIALEIPSEYDVQLMSAALRGGRIPEGISLTLAR